MAITYHPKPGTVLICNFNTGFKAPEMVKRRPAIVVSPRLRRRNNLCTVVPLSTKEPEIIMPYHYKLVLNSPLPPPWGQEQMWVKADMIYTVCFNRLDLIRLKRPRGEPRKYLKTCLDAQQMDAVKRSIMHGIGLV